MAPLLTFAAATPPTMARQTATGRMRVLPATGRGLRGGYSG
jgi:hypothetical protein